MEVEEVLEEEFDEGSDEADNECNFLNEPSSIQFSSGPPSTPNSCASSPPVNNEDSISPNRSLYSNLQSNTISNLTFPNGKPYGHKRGPGRPRKDYQCGIRTLKEGRIVYKKCRYGFTRGTFKKKYIKRDDKIIISSPQDCNNTGRSSKSPTDSFGNLIDSDLMERGSFIAEEMPYFQEKWPGKLCCLCNLGERSQMGQGEMLRIEINDFETGQYYSCNEYLDEKESYSNNANNFNNTPYQISNRRHKTLNKCKNSMNSMEYIDELDKIGHPESIDFTSIQDSNYFYIHRLCATWSFGISREPTGALNKTASVVFQSLRRKCSYCNHFGASIACKMSCSKFFHLPCVSASGGFQVMQSYFSFCNEHLSQISLVCRDDINCRSCFLLGDVANQVMCSICGDHYHGTCIGLPQLPGVRAGWQCLSCRKCQVCRLPDGSEGRSLACEQCHKVYHANCLRPVMSSIPKYGWKCRRCRVCSDCGSRTPGAGASSRWHAHYTVCDSCYQQRNKGFSCPICHRAYRAAAYREMVKCCWCHKFVHSTCDSEADLSVYHSKKEINPDYDYLCPPCKVLIQSGRISNQSLSRRNSTIDDETSSISQDNFLDDTDNDYIEKDFGLGKGKPYLGIKIAKKRIGYSNGTVGRPKGKLNFQKRPRMAEFGRKRGPKSKMRGIFGVPGLGLQRPTSDNRNEEEPGVENRLVLCSAKDKFILTQDICVMCGAIGTDQEGCLISCAHCGQCYHPYCVNVRVTKVILQRGWRCLDCTVCEGCGQKNDESRLILCDECDISFHIYCMDPPLDFVPQGNWKCKWCAICQKCGSNNPGKHSTWKNSYSECGPCASESACSVCYDAYIDGELIIQCINCEMWLHCKCDSINTEEDAEYCDNEGYFCLLCRPKDQQPPHLISTNTLTSNNRPTPGISTSSEENNMEISPIYDASHFVDGVCLSEHGLNSIKSLQMEYIRKKRKQKLSPDVLLANKDAGILATIESVVAGSGIENSIDDTKLEPLDPKEEAEIYKDGMIWERSDASPPEGFALCTNEQGIVVLRKKRQRNLQKLGIGGFNVRNRTIRKDLVSKDEIDENPENSPYASTSEVNQEKKKKPLRRRQKNRLNETYPVYLQEAFFGKNLLDTSKINFESESSEEDVKSSVSEDKIVKLTPEELKILDSIKIEKENLSGINESPVNLGSTINNINELRDNEVHDNNLKNISSNILEQELPTFSLNESKLSAKTPVLTDLRENLNLIKTHNGNDIYQKFVIETPTNSKEVERNFSGIISSTVGTPVNNLPANQPVIGPFIRNNSDLQLFGSNSPNDIKNANILSNSSKNIETSSISSDITHNVISPSSTMSSSSPGLHSSTSSQNPWSSNSCNTRINITNEESLDVVPPAQSNCAQKSSERMRRDEDLGEMATISAVLYANTNHPDLKLEFPNWNDRCKQIYKRWRALSTEKKAPFLQQARDNRSALRMKKGQQIGNKPSAFKADRGLGPLSIAIDSLNDEKEEERSITPAFSVFANVKTGDKLDCKDDDKTTGIKSNLSKNLNDTLKCKGTNKPSCHKIYINANSDGPAPNVTVNAEGVFNTTPKCTLHTYQELHSTKENNIIILHKKQKPNIFLNLHEINNLIQNKKQSNLNNDSLIKKEENDLEKSKESKDSSNLNIFTKIEMDQEKIAIQQKSIKEQEQERQWKQLQSMRAKEQQSQQFTMQGPVRHQFVNDNSRSPNDSRPDPLFGNNTIVTKLHDNTQLRGLLERHESLGIVTNPTSPMLQGTIITKKEWSQTDGQIINNQNVAYDENAFREPFPVRVSNQNVKLNVNNEDITKIPVAIRSTNLKSTQLPDRNSTQNVGLKLSNDLVNEKQRILTNPSQQHVSVPVELEKMEQEDPVAMTEVEGVGDILGELGEDDDDDLLNSLTAEMGADFNILEYADPELDALTSGENHNLLDRLDFDDGCNEDRMKKSNEIKLCPRGENMIQKQDSMTNFSNQNSGEKMFQIKNKNEILLRKDPNIEKQNQERRQFMISQSSMVIPRGISNEALAAQQIKNTMQGIYRAQNLPRYANIISQNNLCKIPSNNHLPPPPPPPPYPGPPPPYPAGSVSRQEQPLLLEDLLEQEKREQQQQHHISTTINTNQTNDKKYTITNMGAHLMKNDSVMRPNQLTMPTNWRKSPMDTMKNNIAPPELDNKIRKETPQMLYNANLQPQPTLPPENIITEQDRIMQIKYEQWLNNQNNALNNQLKYYEDEIFKLRKARKSFNSKQRLMRKSGSDLSPQDAIELAKTTAEQAVMQKNLEGARRQCRQHALLLQEYKNKYLNKVNTIQNIPSPAQVTSTSPMLSPSNSQSSVLMSSQSPLATHMLQSARSPLQSPSPLLSHSPTTIPPSPAHQSNSSPSPYNTMQCSPRIGTPHSQIDESSFSPSGMIPSPSSMSGRHTSPAPHIASPQHRFSNQFTGRIATSPGRSTNTILSNPVNKPNVSQIHHERYRIQSIGKNNTHSDMSGLENQQMVSSPNYAYAMSPDALQSQRTSHLIQQRQIIQQRQQATQNAINQNLMKTKNIVQSPINKVMNSPTSPHMIYNHQQNIRRSNLDNMCDENNTLQNDSVEHFVIRGRDNILYEQHLMKRNNDDNRGGGLQSLMDSVLPIFEMKNRCGKIKLGLFGGSPMWNASNFSQAYNNDNQIVARNETIQTSKTNNGQNTENIKQNNLKEVSGMSREQNKSDDLNYNKSLDINEVIVVDNSPTDQKRRLIDYDDYQDKAFVAKEVSLNAAAQNITDSDDITVIESFSTSELADIVSSPLEPQPVDEYVLFSADVVDYADSDDSLKQSIRTKVEENIKETTSTKSDDSDKNNDIADKIREKCKNNDSMGQIIRNPEVDIIMKKRIPETKNFATREDFEALIDRKTIENENSSKILDGIVKTPNPNMSISLISHNNNKTATNLIPNSSRVSFTSGQCSVVTLSSMHPTSTNSVMVNSKKLVSDVTQTTAKVSIGNTTISVPLLKTMTLNSTQIISSEKQHKLSQNLNLTKQPTILNVRGQKLNPGTIVSLSSLQFKPSPHTKIVQAKVVGKKIPSTSSTSTSIDTSGIKHNLVHTFSYPKLTSLTVLQDMPLPNKILEDENFSPENSMELDNINILERNIEPIEKEILIKTEIDDTKEKILKNTQQSYENKTEKSLENEIDSNKTKIQTRLITTTSQLSPLSQPTEMTTNMANVSQQLRTIMSSISSSTSAQINQKIFNDGNSNEFKKSSLNITDRANKDKNDDSNIIITTTKENKFSSNIISNNFITEQIKDDNNKKTKPNVSESLLSTISTNSLVTSMNTTINTNAKYFINKDIKNEKGTFCQIVSSSNIKRSKSTDDGIERDIPAQISGTKRYSLEVIPSKSDSNDIIDDNNTIINQGNGIQRSSDLIHNGCKISGVHNQQIKTDDTQNVLLKQLLQNSGITNTTTVTSQVITGRKVTSLRAPSLGVVSSLEAQLARPVIPPVPTNTPSLMNLNQSQQQTKMTTIQQETNNKISDDITKKNVQIITRETSFVSNPVHKNDNENSNDSLSRSITTINNDNRNYKVVSPTKTTDIKIEKFSNEPCKNVNLIEKSSNEYQLNEINEDDLKQLKSVNDTQITGQVFVNVTSSSSTNTNEINDNPNLNIIIKEEKDKINDIECNSDLKKRKKRDNQQKPKKQIHIVTKEAIHTKKRSRKLSKLDEDYDNFIDNLMTQLKQMPSLQVLEPHLNRNFGICPPYGSGDLTKLEKQKDILNLSKALKGNFGNAFNDNLIDFYNTKPFGINETQLDINETTIHNSFYDQEFPSIKFDQEFDHSNKIDLIFKDRDIDTPDSFITSSSPECTSWENSKNFPGLYYIDDDDDEIDGVFYNRMSPTIPIVAPIPVKLRSGINLTIYKDECENRENIQKDEIKKIDNQFSPAKDSNLTVTLTLTSSAAEDILGVLRDLANILHIPPPTSYQIVERTTTPPSQKLGLYRTKGKDGKEGDPIDIQTILNGTAKFCRHCDVVILNTIIRAKSSEFPLLTSNEVMNNSDDLFFCSKSCYKQFKWRPTNIIEENLSYDEKLITIKNVTDKSENLDNSTNNIIKEETKECIVNKLNSSYSKSPQFQEKNSPKNSLKYNFQNNFTDKCKNESKQQRYKFFSQGIFNSSNKFKKTSDKEITEMLFRMCITVFPINKMPDDTRQCIFCHQSGDGVADGPSRLLNFDVDKWVHLNCALWSDGVYETVNGALMNLEGALQTSLNQKCVHCGEFGATIKCFKNRCSNIYHLTCAIKDQCVFYKNKTTFCHSHALKNEKENELTTLSVQRRVYVERDEARQVATVMHHSELSNLLRVGSLTFLNVGQLLPHQLQAFHTSHYIYPIGYKIIRFYWSMRKPNKRCRYICSIIDTNGRPEFQILVQEPYEDDIEFSDKTPKAVWEKILEPLAVLRKNCNLVQLFPKFITGEDLFGLTEPAVVRILESLPGVETLTDYRFKYGRNPLLELPLAINPSGAARTEPKQKQTVGWRKPHTQRSGTLNQRMTLAPAIPVVGEVTCPYSKQFVHSKSSQYKKMKQEWRNNVFLARSKIQGLGLYAAKDLEKHTMVIEYIGEVIRTEVSELREKQYESRNRGIYMFRLDEERVIDATLSGGLARYINHSCNPNCVTEIVEVDREYRIIIFAKRRINRGEELSYDYKFDIEDDANKISCMCGAPNCRKWMN